MEKYRSPQEESARLVVEFMEVAVTSIIFLKGVYPRGAFQRRRYLNMVVHKAAHPELNHYIHSSISALLPSIQKGVVDRVALLFYTRELIPAEKFMFRVSLNQSHKSKVQEGDLGFALRAFLIKLSVSEALTKPLPPGCDWEITAYFQELPDFVDEEQRLWIPTDTKLWQHPPLITPIKSMISNPFNLQLYLEHPQPGEPKNVTIL